MKIGIVAPGSCMTEEAAKKLTAFAANHYGEAVSLQFHPQCFMQHGHFAGSDEVRLNAFVETANNPDIGAIWFGRGGYGACRIAEQAVAALTGAAKAKTYMGYSDVGYLLGALYKNNIGKAFHGPVANDIMRDDGEAAVTRALDFLLSGDKTGFEVSVDGKYPTVAYNMAILSQSIGTSLQPNLDGHVVMLEEVGGYMYQLDRAIFHILSSEMMKKAAGIRLGRCNEIIENDRPFGQTEEEILKYWSAKTGIPYLGMADIGHDSANKIVPFGF